MNGRWLAITAMMAWGWGIAGLTADAQSDSSVPEVEQYRGVSRSNERPPAAPASKVEPPRVESPKREEAIPPQLPAAAWVAATPLESGGAEKSEVKFSVPPRPPVQSPTEVPHMEPRASLPLPQLPPLPMEPLPIEPIRSPAVKESVAELPPLPPVPMAGVELVSNQQPAEQPLPHGNGPEVSLAAHAENKPEAKGVEARTIPPVEPPVESGPGSLSRPWHESVWFQEAIRSAVGSLPMLGVLCAILVLVWRLKPVIRIEHSGNDTGPTVSLADLAGLMSAGLAQPFAQPIAQPATQTAAATPSPPSAPADIEETQMTTARPFDLGPTFEEERGLREQDVQQQEAGVLRQLFEDNLKLRDQIRGTFDDKPSSETEPEQIEMATT